MTLVHVHQQGTKLRARQGQLFAEVPGAADAALPLAWAEALVLEGNIHLTGPFIRQCLEQELPVTFTTAGGRVRGWLQPASAQDHVLTRLRQYRLYFSPARQELAAHFVANKLTASLAFFRQQRSHAPAAAELPLRRAIGIHLRGLGVLPRARDLDHLRGLEGAAAAAGFAALGSLVRHPALFAGTRSRRPPLDPFNALLSYGYSLLYAEAVTAATAAGLDPGLGFLHQPGSGRMALALDLMEPYRCRVDALVLKLVNLRRLRAEHFDRRDGGVYLGETGRPLFLAAWAALRRKHLCADLARDARELTTDLARRLPGVAA